MTTNHVVSLELAKELKEAGWKKDTEFYYSESDEGVVLVFPDKTSKGCFGVFGKNGYEVSERSIICPAPLTTEILEEFKQIDIDIFLRVDLVGCFYYFNSGSGKSQEWTDENMNVCNALAKMWLYLKKEGKL